MQGRLQLRAGGGSVPQSHPGGPRLEVAGGMLRGQDRRRAAVLPVLVGGVLLDGAAAAGDRLATSQDDAQHDV